MTMPAPAQKTKAKKHKPVTDKVLAKRAAMAEKNLKRMKERKTAKSRRRKAENAINHNIRSIYEFTDNVERFLVVHGDYKL